MARNPDSRRKNIGFKPPGVDPAHDIVYAVLDSFPRGAASDFIVTAIIEYLKNHEGQTIEGKRRLKYIVLPSAPASVEGSASLQKTPDNTDEKPTQNDSGSKKGTPCFSNISPSPTEDVDSSDKSIKENVARASPPEGNPRNGDSLLVSYTELDDDILDSLVGGFNFPQG